MPQSREEILNRYNAKQRGVTVEEYLAQRAPRKTGAKGSKKTESASAGEVLVGDCRELVHALPRGAYMISDPPYNQGYHYDVYGDALPRLEYQELLRVLFQDRRSVLVHYPEETINVISKVMRGHVNEVMAWVYNSNQGKQHRVATWWGEGCLPDWRKTPQPYKNPTDKRVAKLIEAGKSARGYDWVEIDHVKNVAAKGHPCPIPYALAERLVLATTNPGDLVCDPFAGIGTVLLAAKRNGRRVIGFELSPAYAAIANAALAQVPS